MATFKPVELPYGNLGEARFSIQSRQWQFEKNLDQDYLLHPVTITNVDASPSLPTTTKSKKLNPRRNTTTKLLYRGCPELAPAGNQFPDLLRASQAVENLSAAQDPVISELLDFGYVQCFGTDGSKLLDMQLCVAVCGDSPGTITLSCVHTGKLQLEDSQDVPYEFPVVSDEGCRHSVEAFSPVQQVSFSRSGNRVSDWLAVRTLHGTAILEPSVRAAHTILSSATSEQDPVDQNFRYNVNIKRIVFIPTDATGGTAHADLSFNPWDRQQLGIIDTTGRWQVFRTEQYKKDQRYEFISTHSKIVAGDIPNIPNSQCADDGWARMLWVGDTETIIAATRTNATIHTIRSKMVEVSVSGLDIGNEGDWLLDIKRNETNTNVICVLTSRRVILLRVATTTDQSSTDVGEASSESLLSCYHYRNPHDINMRITLATDHDAIIALLYSRVTCLATSFSFIASRGASASYTISQPQLFRVQNSLIEAQDVVNTIDVDDRHTELISICLECITSEGRSRNEDPDQEEIGKEKPHKLYHLCLLDGQHRTKSNPYIYTKQKKDSFTGRLFISYGDGRRKVTEDDVEDAEDDFVVSDGHLSEDEITSTDKSEKLSGADGNKGKDSESDETTWTTSKRWLYQHIETLARPRLNDSTASLSFEQAMENVLENRSHMEQGIHTLSEFFQHALPIDQVDKVSDAVTGLLQAIQESSFPAGEEKDADSIDAQRLRALSLTRSESANSIHATVDDRQKVHLVPLYESLLKTWLAPLDRAITGRVRVRLEKVIREVAINVFLASHGVQPIAPQDQPALNGDALGSSQDFILPVREKDLGSQVSNGKKPATRIPVPGELSSQPQLGPLSKQPPRSSLRLSSQNAAPGSGAESTTSRAIGSFAYISKDVTLPASLNRLVNMWKQDLGNNGDREGFRWSDSQGQRSADDFKASTSTARRKRRSEQRTVPKVLSSQEPERSSGMPPAIKVTEPQSSQISLPVHEHNNRSWAGRALAGSSSQALPLGSSQLGPTVTPSARKKRRAGF